MPKKKYIKSSFPRKGVDWKKIKREKEKKKVLTYARSKPLTLPNVRKA